jgi:UDP-glucose 4-epimerase
MMAINVDAAFELAHWAAVSGTRRFLLASTGNVYRASAVALDEHSPCEPESMYAATKLCAEHLVQQYQQLMEVIIFRLFGVYGPGQEGMLIPSLIGRVARGEEIVLAHGKGLFITPLHVQDCVEMILAATRSTTERRGTFNLCGSETLHLGEIVRMIGEIIGQPPRIRITDDMPRYLIGKNDSFGKAFGLTPTVRFREGLEEVARGFS